MDRLLYSAKDAQELLRLFGAGVSGTVTPWILLWPSARQQIMIWQGTIHNLDALLTSPVARIPFSRSGQAVGSGSDWGDRLTELLAYQFPHARQTLAMAPAWWEDELFAVLGLAGAEGPDDDANTLVQDLAGALRNLREKETLSQELHGCQFLLSHCSKAWLLARKDGSILAGTPGGMDALNMAVYSGRRRNLKEAIQVIPEKLLGALQDERKEVTLTDKVTVITTPFSPRLGSTVRPLYVVDFRVDVRPSATGIDGASLGQLTPAQKEVYELLIEGLRNKEISARLSISTHTVRHHVSEVLRKLRCMDRLQLVARCRHSGATSNMVSPVAGTIPTVTPPADLSIRRGVKTVAGSP